MRRLFREGGFEAKLARGELIEHFDIDRPLNPDEVRSIRNAVTGTRRQYVLWLDRAGKTIVEVHRYMNPDGTLAASRKNDPKRITIKGITYGKASPAGQQPRPLTSAEINAILDKHGLPAAMTYFETIRLKVRYVIYHLRGK